MRLRRLLYYIVLHLNYLYITSIPLNNNTIRYFLAKWDPVSIAELVICFFISFMTSRHWAWLETARTARYFGLPSETNALLCALPFADNRYTLPLVITIWASGYHSVCSIRMKTTLYRINQINRPYNTTWSNRWPRVVNSHICLEVLMTML